MPALDALGGVCWVCDCSACDGCSDEHETSSESERAYDATTDKDYG